MSNLVQSVDWLAIAPPTLTAVVALAVLVADLFLPADRKNLLGWLSIAGLSGALALLLPLLGEDRSTFCLTEGPEACSYTADSFTLVIQLLVLGAALLTALLSTATTKGLPQGEYWFLLLSSAAGAALLPAARDLATLIVALEVASLPAFALVGLKRGDRRSSEAALKFFLSSVTATAVSLLGVSFVYAATGSLHLTTIARADVDPQLALLMQTGVVLTLVGFAFKTAAAPFHFWVPDTYIGAPLPVAAYLSVVGKAVGLSGLVLLTVVAFPGHADIWGPALAALAALTMTLGNAAALRQDPSRAYGAVRLLAWSSIGQAGYLLVPIAAAAYGDDRPDGQVIGSTVAYALMYAAVNLGAFAVAALVGRRHGLNRLADYQGLHAAHPLAALALAFFLLCLAGLPPGIIGLFAKVTVFSTAVEAGLGWLAVLMAVNVVVALVYYLRWTALLFRTPSARTSTDQTSAWHRVPLPLTLTIALAAVLGVVLSGAPQLVLRFADTTLF